MRGQWGGVNNSGTTMPTPARIIPSPVVARNEIE